MSVPKKNILKGNLRIIIAIASMLLALFALWVFEWFGWLGWGPANWSSRKINGVVQEKVIKGNRYFLYFLPDGSEKVEVLVVEDSKWFLNWDSGDDYANIHPQTHYELKVAGYRNPWRSAFRNVVDYKPTTVHRTSASPTEFPREKLP
jgi:hypothetical protein